MQEENRGTHSIPINTTTCELHALAPIRRQLPQHMGRQNHGAVALSSTIALLRERFKKLERVREMREERELHRSLTGRGGQVISLQSPEQPKWLFPGALPSCSGHVVDTSLTVGSWHCSNGAMSSETDVDTSLHL